MRHMSEIGMLYPAPALLSSTFRVPPVNFWTSETHADRDDSERTSNVSVSIPDALRAAILDGVLAVANTRYPAL
jgi:hypothetical protein